MNETKSAYRTSEKNHCPVCCGPLQIQDVGGEVAEVILWCQNPLCYQHDETHSCDASKLTGYGVQAANEESAFEILTDRISKMPEEPSQEGPDQDEGSDR